MYEPEPGATQPPAAMPLVALVLSVVGLCFAPLLLVGLVLAIISLTRSSQPAYARRKTMAIIALVVPLAMVPVTGIVAAIAIPNFIRFQARAKQTECRVGLQGALAAEEAYRVRAEAYTSHPAELDWTPPPNRRYAYRFAGAGPLASGDTAAPSDVGYAPAAGGAPGPLDEALGSLALELGPHGQCPGCSITIACAGNIDRDEAVDVWSVSSAARTGAGGESIPAGALHHDVDDLEVSQATAAEGTATTGGPAGRPVEPSANSAEAPEDGWVTYSADGRSTLRQTSRGPTCELACDLPDGRQAWAAERPCVPATAGRRFVAPDCERWLVLIPAPARGKPWQRTEVMQVYARAELAYSVTGAAVLSERRMANSPSWLQGCFGVPGPEPHYAADGLAVEYVMLDGTPGRVPLVASADATTDEAPPPAQRPKRPRKRR